MPNAPKNKDATSNSEVFHHNANNSEILPAAGTVNLSATGNAPLQAELKKFKVKLTEESRAKNKNLS